MFYIHHVSKNIVSSCKYSSDCHIHHIRMVYYLVFEINLTIDIIFSLILINSFEAFLIVIRSKIRFINPFLANVPFPYPLKTSENQGFSDVFRVYRNGVLPWIGLIYSKALKQS